MGADLKLSVFIPFWGLDEGAPGGWSGGLLCLTAIFAPSFLLVLGALPSWQHSWQYRRLQAALMGAKCSGGRPASGGPLFAVWTSAIHEPQDFALAVLALHELIRRLKVFRGNDDEPIAQSFSGKLVCLTPAEHLFLHTLGRKRTLGTQFQSWGVLAASNVFRANFRR